MNRSGHTTGIAISALLAVVDVVGVAAVGMDDAPPLAIVVGTAIIGVVTLLALRPALHGVRGGVLTVVVSRAVSALGGLPVYFVDGAPGWAKIATAIAIALTLIGIWLLRPALRPSAVPAVA